MLDVKTSRSARKKARGRHDQNERQSVTPTSPAATAQPSGSEATKVVRTFKDGLPFNEIDIDLASLA
jgi:hypothetical protein